MKTAIMQPYFFPYIGYWQMMHAVDTYIIFDNVNFMTRSWINRNRILINSEPAYVNLPLIGASQNKLIYDIEVDTSPKAIGKVVKKVEYAYKKAPCFDKAMPLFLDIMSFDDTRLPHFLFHSFTVLCDYLGLTVEFALASELDQNVNLKGQERIIALCKQLGTSVYCNAIGGRELYDHARFDESEIELKFLSTGDIRYAQFGNDFQPNLSILDMMMFCPSDEIAVFLEQYKLID